VAQHAASLHVRLVGPGDFFVHECRDAADGAGEVVLLAYDSLPRRTRADLEADLVSGLVSAGPGVTATERKNIGVCQQFAKSPHRLRRTLNVICRRSAIQPVTNPPCRSGSVTSTSRGAAVYVPVPSAVRRTVWASSMPRGQPGHSCQRNSKSWAVRRSRLVAAVGGSSRISSCSDALSGSPPDSHPVAQMLGINKRNVKQQRTIGTV
jgi:hypothetical protein